MRTYDYILAMREGGAAFDPFEDSDSDESIDFDSLLYWYYLVIL